MYMYNSVCLYIRCF